MLKINRDNEEIEFEDPNELLIYIAESMATRSELSHEIHGLRSELKQDMAKMEHRLLDRIDSKADEVKMHTAQLLQNKEIITKKEVVSYIKGEL